MVESSRYYEKLDPLSTEEEKDLHNVFHYICHYIKRKKWIKKMTELDTLRTKRILRNNYNNVNISSNINAISSTTSIPSTKHSHLSTEEDSQEKQKLLVLSNEIETVRNFIEEEKLTTFGKITSLDLFELMKDLGKPMPKKEIEEMIWEIDDDSDGGVNWNEFKLLYQRHIVDKLGIEPGNRLYHIILFLIFDKDHNASVSLEEIIQMLRTRYNNDNMMNYLTSVWKEEKQEKNSDGSLSFADYIVVISPSKILPPSVLKTSF